METFIGTAITNMVSAGVSVEFTKRYRVGKFGYNFFYDGSHKDYGKRPICKIHFYNNSMEENFGIFVHEYCHFLQWQENIPLWSVARDSNEKFDDWIQRKIDTVDIQHVRNIQLLELDCDKRAIKIIEEYDLPVNIPKYIKESNGYIMSHNIMYKARDFFVCSAYSSPNVTQYTPDHHITEDELDYCPDEFTKEFLLNVN